VKFVTEALDGREFARDDDWSLVIWDLTLRLGVDTKEVEIFPDLLHQLVEVPLILG